MTLKLLFEEDAALRELDGARYLSRLAQAAETIINAAEYGRIDPRPRPQARPDQGRRGRGQPGLRPPAGRRPAASRSSSPSGSCSRWPRRARSRASSAPSRVVLTEAIKHIESAWHKVGKVSGVPTKLTGLDQKLGGLQPSDLLILAGRPSMGKTALAVTIAANAASAAERLAPEAPRRGTATTWSACSRSRCRPSSWPPGCCRARAGSSPTGCAAATSARRTGPRVVRASQELGALPLFIDDTPALSIAALRTRARRLKRTQGLDLLVVDYLQLLRGTGAQSQTNRVQEITEITQGLKAMAKDLHVPVLALSQLVARGRIARGQAADALGPARVRLDRAGRRRGDVRLPRGVLPRRARSRPSARARPRRSSTCATRNGSSAARRSHNKAEVIIAKQRHGPIGNVAAAVRRQFRPVQRSGARPLPRAPLLAEPRAVDAARRLG